MAKACYIIGAMPTNDIYINTTDNPFVIAADGGLTQLNKIKIIPDLVVGDFDSLNYHPIHPAVVKLPCEKDDTDVHASIKEGLARGYKLFYIFGGIGGRLDHTFANIQLLSFLTENNASGFLFGDGLVATVIKNSKICFKNKKEGILSVFSVSDTSQGVFINGLKYSLDNAIITASYPIGISNEFIDASSIVSVKNGSLLLMWNDIPKKVIKDYEVRINE